MCVCHGKNSTETASVYNQQVSAMGGILLRVSVYQLVLAYGRDSTES